MADNGTNSHSIQVDDPLDSTTASCDNVSFPTHPLAPTVTNTSTLIDNSTSSSIADNSLTNESYSLILPSIVTTSTTAATTNLGNSSSGVSSGFSLPAFNPFKDSTENQNPFSPAVSPLNTPLVTPLGSPTRELHKLSLGVERYARAIEDPGPMGSFSGMVPLPSLSQTDHTASRRRPSHGFLDAIPAESKEENNDLSQQNRSQVDSSSKSTGGGGLNLSSIKRAISGRRRLQDLTMMDLESNHGGTSAIAGSSNNSNNTDIGEGSERNALGNLFSSPTLPSASNSDAQIALLDGLSYSPQPLLLPTTTFLTSPLQEAVNESRAQVSAGNDEIRRQLEQSNNQPVAAANVQAAAASESLNDQTRSLAGSDITAVAGMRRRKPKGGILSQLLKLQRNEAVVAAAAASGSPSGADKRSGNAQHAQVKKTKKGFYYRSSSKNNSLADLTSPSVTTTPRVSPRTSRIFDLDPSSSGASSITATTRVPTQPSMMINNSNAPANRHNPREHMEEMETFSAAATTAATLTANLGIQRDIVEILTRQSFLIMVAKTLILYGAPSHRIEETCALLARKMDVDASFALLPGLMTISFSDPETHTSDTRHLRCTQGMDMYKLSKVYTIALGVLHGADVEEANKALEVVTAEPGYYPVWVTVMSWMFAAAFVAPLAFNGSWLDTLLAGFCGLLVGLLGLVAAKFPVYGNVFEMTSSILVGFIAKAFGDRVCFSASALAGVVILLPGLLLTQSIMELASRNIVSGAVRMFYALMYAFFLGFGLSLGAEIWDFIGGASIAPASACENGVNQWWMFFILPAFSTSINIVFNAHPSQWFGMTIVTTVGYTVSYFMTSGSQVTSVVAAFAVGVVGQAYGRLTGKLSYVPLLSGVLLLVPGSVGVRGVLAIIGSDPSQGFQFALRMVNISVSITLGVFCSALVWYPFWRKSTFMNF